jgi:aconitase A
VSNRKYAGLLEGNNRTDDDRMKSITKALADNVNEMLDDILRDLRTPMDDGVEKGIQSYIRRQFANTYPGLEKDYEVMVGATQDFTDAYQRWKMHVGYRKKHKIEFDWDNDWESLSARTINASSITAGRITTDHLSAGAIRADTIRANHTHDIQTLRITERYGMGVINTDGIAVAGNITFHDGYAPNLSVNPLGGTTND